MEENRGFRRIDGCASAQVFCQPVGNEGMVDVLVGVSISAGSYRDNRRSYTIRLREVLLQLRGDPEWQKYRICGSNTFPLADSAEHVSVKEGRQTTKKASLQSTGKVSAGGAGVDGNASGSADGRYLAEQNTTTSNDFRDPLWRLTSQYDGTLRIAASQYSTRTLEFSASPEKVAQFYEPPGRTTSVNFILRAPYQRCFVIEPDLPTTKTLPGLSKIKELMAQIALSMRLGSIMEELTATPLHEGRGQRDGDEIRI